MFQTGLVTISFRSLTPSQIIEISVAAGLKALEWGGDVHVPPTDVEYARRVAEQTRNAGLMTAAYGSYYRLLQNNDPRAAFAPVLETACALQAPVIRIWGGVKGSAELTQAEWEAMVAEGRLLVEMASEKGITLSLECHNWTVTDEYHAALRYLEAVPGLTMYWQPNQFIPEQENYLSAQALAPYVTNLHVFHWLGNDRYPLADGEEIWKKYLSCFQDRDRWLLLEFMHDDRPESLAQTAEALRRLIESSNSKKGDA